MEESIYTSELLRETSRGVKVFSEHDFYWPDSISKDNLQEVNKRLEKGDDLLSTCRQLNVPPQYLGSYYRSDFIYTLPYKPGGFKVLDLGAGFGNITIPLSQKMSQATIYAVDASMDILDSLAIRAKRLGCNNIEFIKTDIFEKNNLPFKEKTFDLILMNGVLEWIGNGDMAGNPRDHQLSFLEYVKSLLKDEGVLYIGIEGRFFPGYFKDVKDPHSKILYTSIVPRKAADWLCKLHGKENGYRTYIYSLSGYKKLFKQAGFFSKFIEVVYPVVSYKDPIFWFFYKDLAAYKYAFTELTEKMFGTKRNIFIYKVLYCLGLEKFFAASYLFLIHNKNYNKEQCSLLNHYLQQYLPDYKKFQPVKVFSNLNDDSYAGFLLIDPKSGKPKYSFKIKRLFDGNRKNLEVLDFIKRMQIREFLLPEKYDELCQLRSFWTGQVMPRNNNSLEKAVNLIKGIHHKLSTGKFRLSNGLELDTGFVHGDYTLDNILIKDSIIRVIDFENSLINNVQIFDIVILLLNYYQSIVSPIHLNQKMLSEESLTHFRNYYPGINREEVKEILKYFYQQQQSRFSNLNQRKFNFYKNLLYSLESEID